MLGNRIEQLIYQQYTQLHRNVWWPLLLSSLVWQAPQIICGTLPSPSPAEKNDAKTRLSPHDDHNGSGDLDDDDDDHYDDWNGENDTLVYSSYG